VMSAAELEEHLAELYPGGRQVKPAFWIDHRFSNPDQPVVGVCWHEVRAFARWLAEQTGQPFRLPTEVQWEAAARGAWERSFPFGDELDASFCNVLETHLQRTTPVGALVHGDTPDGTSDLAGNVWEWTSSAFGNLYEDPDGLSPAFGYPYDGTDGREEPDTGPEIARVARGGSWINNGAAARAAARYGGLPDTRAYVQGGRLCVSGSPSLDSLASGSLELCS